MTESRYIGEAVGWSGASRWMVEGLPGPQPPEPRRFLSRISDNELRQLQLRALAGERLIDLARSMWERVGYKNPSSAADAISRGFTRLGFAPIIRKPKRARRRSVHARRTPRRRTL